MQRAQAKSGFRARLVRRLPLTFLGSSCFCWRRCPVTRSPAADGPMGQRGQRAENCFHWHDCHRTITGRDRRGGLMFAYGEGQSKKMLAGIVFGVGMAIGAVNFMAWLFPG